MKRRNLQEQTSLTKEDEKYIKDLINASLLKLFYVLYTKKSFWS